jgi:monoamine oxidase
MHRPSGSSGDGEAIIADWCISTIPLPILARVKNNNFTDEYREAIEAVQFADTCKVGWQTRDRFWETKDQMYGGISYTTDNITQMWYPSWAYFSDKGGILTGAYNYDDDARKMQEMGLKGRLKLAMEGGMRLHPDFQQHVDINLGLSIAWKQVPYQEGGWADDWSCDQPVYNRLLKPEGQFWVAGDQVSYLSGWQEGAVLSAHHVLSAIAGVAVATPMLKAKPASKRKAPGVRRRTRGLP